MSRCLSLALVVLLVSWPTMPAANADEAADLEAIGQLNEDYVQAFNRHDSAAIGRLFTTKGDYLILTGDLLEGPEAVAAGHASFFRNNPEVKLSGKALRRRFLAPDLVLSNGQWKASGGPAGVPSEGQWNAVYRRVGGQWRYETIRISIPARP